MFTLKNERSIKFYKEHPEIDFDGINLTVVDLLEKLVDNMSSTVNQNLSIELLKEVSAKILSIENNNQHQLSMLNSV